MSDATDRAPAKNIVRKPHTRSYQVVIVALCTVLNMIDGYDLLVVGFTLPHLPEGFATNPQKGYLLSAALAGMAIGAIGLARFADVFGRRRVLIAGLAVNTIGLAGSALSTGFATLLVSRLVTGAAIGTISVVIIVLGQEVVSQNRRSLALGVIMIGSPIGTMLAGFASAGLMSMAGGAWQGLFWIGAAAGCLSLVLTAVLLRESTDFVQTTSETHVDVRLLGPDLRYRTLLLASGYSMIAAAYYFIGTWTPQLISDVSGSTDSGAFAGIMVGVGQVIGGCVYGALGVRVLGARIAAAAAVIASVAVAAFAVALDGPVAQWLAAILGGTVFAALTGYVATSTAVYPLRARAKGYGAMLGVGRGGAIMAPVVAGYALNVVDARAMYLAVTVPLMIAALAAMALTRVARSSENGRTILRSTGSPQAPRP
ncbi:MFS transporter [Nocardia sp. FBN12]|uniref:MFS transporter n=1 Tax=Nocardia sp. FBN12 TaxID=3419766 RepID=UPI003CFDA756